MTFEEKEHVLEVIELGEELKRQFEKLEFMEREAASEEWGEKALKEGGPVVEAEIKWLLGELQVLVCPG